MTLNECLEICKKTACVSDCSSNIVSSSNYFQLRGVSELDVILRIL